MKAALGHLKKKNKTNSSHIFLLLRHLSLQTFLLSLLLLFLLAVRVEGRTVYIIARNAKSCTKTVVLLLVGCSERVSLCYSVKQQRLSLIQVSHNILYCY